MIYIIRAGETEFVKIGKAADPEGRLHDLQCAHHDELTIIRLIDAPDAAERWLHREFKHLRVRNEWFRFDPAMLTVEVPDLSPSFLAQVEEVIAAMGGLDAVAALTGVSATTVMDWRLDGIPPPHWPAILAAAQERGIYAVTLQSLMVAQPKATEPRTQHIGSRVDHDLLIMQLGGKAAIARALGLPVMRLCKWHVRGIPFRYFQRICEMAAAKGIGIREADLHPPATRGIAA